MNQQRLFLLADADLTIAVSLFLSGMVLMVSKNLSRTVHDWRAEARFAVYLAPEHQHLRRGRIERQHSADILDAAIIAKLRRFQARWDPALVAEGPVRMTWAIEPAGDDTCKLTVTHEGMGPRTATEFVPGIAQIVSGLKSLLETGTALSMG